MTALIVIGIILLVFLLIALLRVGVSARLEENVFFLRAVAGPIKLQILPQKEDKAKKPKEPKKKKSKKNEQKTDDEKGKEKEKPKIKITIDLIKTILSAVGDLLGRLRRKITIDKLTLHYTAASDDPYSAAMTFGYASAAVNALVPVLDNSFRIRDRDIGAAVTIDSPDNIIFVDVQLTLAVWEIIYIGLAAWPVVKALLAKPKKGKVENNGQASDQ